MKLLSWNCRGVGGPRAVRSLGDVVRTYRPSILGLIETKKEDSNWEFLKYRLGFDACFSVVSHGRAGGLAMLWNKDTEVTVISYSASHIDVKKAMTSWAMQTEGLQLKEKLRDCMGQLARWNGSAFGRMKDKIRELKEDIQDLRVGVRSEETIKREVKLSEELAEWLGREELYWRQRSRAEWLRNGDINTAYFHAKASQRKRRNHIEKLRNSSGELCHSEPDIFAIITNYFSNIFHSQVNVSSERWHREFEAIPKLITTEKNEMLGAPFTEMEVKGALFQMHPTKAPGLDGFPALFFQNNWDIVGEDVTKEVLNCLNNKVLDAELNETLIVLIPKVRDVEKVEDLRPISLCKVVMKIITKVLANRGRLITDNILIAHEVSQFIKGAQRRKTCYMSMKLDMSKAYNRIEWRFLEKMLASMGFAEEWIERIMLYPEIGLIKGIKICRGAPTITNLMFADDCLLFVKSSKESLSWISDILRWYEAVSGQKINLAKSEVVCSNSVPGEVRQELVMGLGMKIVDGHSSYLGFPNGFSHKKTALFRNFEKKVIRKIGDSKHKLLSSAGREFLIKSVLQAIPNYAMACFRLPLTLCRRLAGDSLKFWWSNNKNKGIHWIRADEVFKEKVGGGMGFRKLELMNLAMLAKQGWRFLTEPELLVSKLFKAKYFPDSDVLNASLGSRPSFAWRGILEAVDIVRHGADWDSREGRYRWTRDGSGRFSVKGAYLCARELERFRNPVEGEQSDAQEVQGFWRNFWRLKGGEFYPLIQRLPVDEGVLGPLQSAYSSLGESVQ
ncbi:hypothetical protein QQ045_008986 [Rhodiola kirilowii]